MRVTRKLTSDFRSGRLIQNSWHRDFPNILGKSQPSSSGLESISQIISVEKGPEPIQRLEAALLISQDPMPPRKLVALADLADATQVRTLTRELNKQYRDFGNSFSVEEVAGGYILLTRSQFSPWIKKLQGTNQSEQLSQSALESLAIVAYRQPVMRVDVEAIRGFSCEDMLRQLLEKDLIRICGRSEELGRPYLYGTTKRFLQLFGLQSLDKLPRVEWLRRVESSNPNSMSEEYDSTSSK